MPPRKRSLAVRPARSTSCVPGGALSYEALVGLALRVRHLEISRRDPEAFFEEKSEIAGELMILARELE